MSCSRNQPTTEINYFFLKHHQSRWDSTKESHPQSTISFFDDFFKRLILTPMNTGHRSDVTGIQGQERLELQFNTLNVCLFPVLWNKKAGKKKELKRATRYDANECKIRNV